LNSPLEFIRPNISSLEPYKPSKESYKIKLNANESPYDIPLEIKEKIWSRVKKEKFNYYYDPSCDELREYLAEYTGVKPEQIFVGSGSDEIISDLVFTFAGLDSEAIIPSPGFSSYEIFTTVSGAKVIKVPLLLENKAGKWTWDLDVEKIKSYFNKDRRQMLFLCHPNNPTGDYFKTDQLMELINSFDGIIGIDEAYYEFGGKTFAHLISQYPNIVVMRTFSKIFSLAGLRIGYAIADEEVLSQFYKVKLPYNVNVFSQIAAIEMLKNIDWINGNREKLIKFREEVKNALEKMPGVIVYPSSANFLLCKFEKPRDVIYDELLKKGILVRKFNDMNLEDTLRFSIGTEEENDMLISSLEEILGQI
jgi:histidinol-phosphate aminotransferase